MTGDEIQEALAKNRAVWDELAEVHTESPMYDVKNVIDGKISLQPIELDEIPDLKGKSVLHLQCHIGTDSISLARLGARRVVGVDFSPGSIQKARDIAGKTEVADAIEFVESTVDDAPEKLNEQFDVVYTTWGVLCWLPSITDWALAINKMLKTGGELYVADEHPVACAVSIDESIHELRPYQHGQSVVVKRTNSYADRTHKTENEERNYWAHGLGDIVSALAGQGIAPQWLHEHNCVYWDRSDHPGLVQGDDGLYRTKQESLPLTFSLLAIKH